jgi:hypothetical protein
MENGVFRAVRKAEGAKAQGLAVVDRSDGRLSPPFVPSGASTGPARAFCLLAPLTHNALPVRTSNALQDVSLAIAGRLARPDHGALKFQRALSLAGSNRTSAGVQPPTAVRARDSLESGTTLGMMR